MKIELTDKDFNAFKEDRKWLSKRLNEAESADGDGAEWSQDGLAEDIAMFLDNYHALLDIILDQQKGKICQN